jgi:acid phosphatase (class A)
MKFSRRTAAVLAALLACAGGATWWSQRPTHHYLSGETAGFVAMFPPPPPAASAQTRGELDQLLTFERTRSEADVAAARVDRKTDISRFFGALGFAAGASPDLPQLRRLAERVEDDIRPYVRDAKNRFRRLRPYEIEPRLHPCIGDVRGDLSYPSGHATYGYVFAYLLRDMVPERRAGIMRRGDEFARQRMVCGVHFQSDLDAARAGAYMLWALIDGDADYHADANAATADLRAALGLPPLPL